MIKQAFLLHLLIPLASLAYGKQAISSSGADISGSGGAVSYTVGQLLYQSHHSTEGSESQGVHHPVEIYVYPGIQEQKSTRTNVLVFPNPVTHSLTAVINEVVASGYEVMLSDIIGKVLFSTTTHDQIFSLDMSSYARAVYFLKIYTEGKQIDVLRIVKN